MILLFLTHVVSKIPIITSPIIQKSRSEICKISNICKKLILKDTRIQLHKSIKNQEYKTLVCKAMYVR